MNKCILNFIILCLFTFASTKVYGQIPINDSCYNATPITDIEGECNNYYLDSASFDFVNGSCAGATNENTWFTFVPQATSADITINTPGVAFALVLLPNGCDNLNGAREYGCVKSPGTMNATNLIIGATYYIIVTTEDINTNDIELCIDNPIPPPNDNACNAENIPTDGCVSGTTEGATQDPWIFNLGCQAAQENSVYYTIQLQPNTDTLIINIESTTITGDVSIGLITYPNGCTSNPQLVTNNSFYCGPFVNTYTFGGLPGGTQIYVIVSSTHTGAGDFTNLCITEKDAPPPCGPNISCADAEVITLAPLAETICVDGCNVNMPDGPQINGGGACSDMTSPTAWYTFTTGPTTNSVVFDLSSSQLNSPLFAVFSDCNTMVACNPVNMDAFGNTQYWVAVTDANGLQGDFELCLTQLYLTDPCITSQSLTVIAASLGSNLNGPFKPCEDVKFEYQTNFIKLGAQWIHSMFPVFSECFDRNPEDEPTPSTRPGSKWNWYGSNTVFWKPLDNSNSAIGINSATNQICITGTNNCTSFIGGGNCSYAGTAMPAAWIGVQYSGTCNSIVPNESWGDNAAGPFKVQFTVQIPCDACTDTVCNKYIVGITAFSDGQTGGWQSNSCNGHTLVSKKLSIKCCVPPTMTLENGTTCSDVTFFGVITLDPTNSTIKWTVENANGVTGATSGESSTFSQTLHNGSNSPKTVRYKVIPISPDGCEGDPQFLDVLVYPAVIANAGPDKVSCPGATITLGGTPPATGGDGGPYTFKWSNGETTSTISVTPSISSVFILTVTDGSGCTGTDEVKVTVNANIVVDIIPKPATFCLSQLQGKTLTANSNATNNPLTYTWTTPWGNPGTKTIDIVPQPPGPYNIIVQVLDAIGCRGIGTTTLTLLPNPPVSITNKPQDLCEGDSYQLQSNPSVQDGTVFTSVPPGAVSNDGLINTSVMQQGVDYTFYATFTDVNGCVGKDSVILKSIHYDDPFIDPIGPFCANDFANYQLTATPAGGVFSGPGINGSGVFIPGSLGGSGSYDITYTVGDLACNKSITIQIVINPIPIPQIIPPTEFCKDGGLDPIIVGLPLGGVWSGSSVITQDGTVLINSYPSGLYNATYTVTEAGYTDSISTPIFISDQPTATLNPNGDVCNDAVLDPNNTLVDLSTYILGGDLNGSWSEVAPLSGAVNTIGSVWDFKGLADGTVATFQYTVTANPPCQDFTGQVVITVNDNCACAKLNISSVADLCNSNALVDLNSLENDSDPGDWTMISGPDLTVLAGNTFDATGKVAGTYVVRFTLNPPPQEQACPKYIDVSIKVSEEVVLNMVPELLVCNSSPTAYKTKLDMKKFFVGNIIPGSWTNVSNVGAQLSNDTINFAGVAAGQYTFIYITSTAVAPCPNDTQTVIVNVTIDCACPTLTVIQPNEKLCNSGGTKDLSTMINSNKTGKWTLISDPSGPVNITLANTLFDATGKAPGAYTFKFTITESIPSDCDSTVTVTIDVYPEVKIDLVDVLKVCNSSPNPIKTKLDLTLFLGGQSVPSGTWTNDDNLGTLVSGTNYDFTGVPAGDYHFTYRTNTAIAPCTDASETVIVRVTDECNCPDLSVLQPSDVLCNDNGSKDLGLMINSSLPGSWKMIQDPSGPVNVPMGSGIFDATGKAPGVYQFSFEINDNVPVDCDSVVTIQLTVNPAVIYQLKTIVDVCNTDPSNIDADILDINGNKVWASALVNGSWDPGTSGAINLGGGKWNFSGVAVGTYTFTFTPNTAVAPCPNTPQSITVNVVDNCACPPLPPLPAISPICNNATAVTLPLPTAATGTWRIVSPIGAGFATITNNTFAVTNATGGTYTLEFTYDNIPVGCPSTDQLTVVISEYKTAGKNGSSKEFCEGTVQVLDLFDEITGEDSGGIWSDVIGNAGTAFTPTTAILKVKDLKAGDYTFNYRFNSSGSCPGSDIDVNVHICGIPIADAGADQKLTCTDKEASIGAAASQGPAYSYAWRDIKNGNPVQFPNQLQNIITLPGIYVLTVKDINCGCEKSDTVEIVAEGIPERVDITAVGPSCHNYTNGYIKIDKVVGGNQPYQYAFNDGAPGAASSWNNLGAGTFKITMIDATGCRIDLSTTFKNPQLLTVDLGNDTIIKIGDTVLIDPIISIPDSNVATITYSSDYDFINCTDCFTINVFPNQTTTYRVEVKDKNGCTDSDDKRIIVKKGVNIFVPNIFTPNGDGKNDKVIVSTNTKEIKKIISFQIFDRWGEKVFEEKDFPPNDQTHGWDGKLKGQPMTPAVFVYWLEIELFDGTTEIVKGDITLIR